jgi:CMP/dCMP kinase
MREIITITGDVGSGKSTIGKIIAETLGYRHISTGLILREIAVQRGITIIKMNEVLFDEKEIDEEIDSYIRHLSNSEERLVLDSRMAWYFAENAYDVYVSVDPFVGAKRVFSDKRVNEVHHDLEDAVKNNLRRKSLEDERFSRLYGLQCNELSLFDLIVDSTWVEPHTVAQVILEAFHDTSTDIYKPKGYICPRSLYPTEDVRNIAEEKTIDIFNSINTNGYDNTKPISVVRLSNYFFIIDGHKRTSCALRLGISHIPCVIHDAKEETATKELTYKKEVLHSIQRPFIYDWEDAHSFRFASFPDEQGNPVIKQ